MRRYVESPSAYALIARLEAEGIVTKVQLRTGGPYRGGIPFRRGSLFHLLKNPVYRGKIVHKGKVYDGEHEAIVDEDLWDQVQMHLRAKAPPRKRPANDPQRSLLGRLLSDPEGRQIVPTYATKGTRRYSYYETRKDLARPHDPPSTRFRQGDLDRHITDHLAGLLDDEHALRRMTGLVDAEQLRMLFAAAKELKGKLITLVEVQPAIRSLVALIKVHNDQLELTLRPKALGLDNQPYWIWPIPLPVRKPFREAKLRIDAERSDARSDRQLVELIADAFAVHQLVTASPELTLSQLARREARCRTQLARLLRISWLSPRIIEAVIAGSQPKGLTRRNLFASDIPVDWAEQERQFGLAA